MCGSTNQNGAFFFTSISLIAIGTLFLTLIANTILLQQRKLVWHSKLSCDFIIEAIFLGLLSHYTP